MYKHEKPDVADTNPNDTQNSVPRVTAMTPMHKAAKHAGSSERSQSIRANADRKGTRKNLNL